MFSLIGYSKLSANNTHPGTATSIIIRVRVCPMSALASASANGDCCPGCQGDVDGDLAVDVSDVLQVVGNWGVCQ